jgi:release factor glutamine methyltransferase
MMTLDPENYLYILKQSLGHKFNYLEDKPEETADSSLRALWYTASGNPKSAEEAVELHLPELTDSQIEFLHQLIEKRLNNTPLAHITGRQRFMGMDFICDRRALIPRKETEILGWKALNLTNEIAKIQARVNIIDVCCGSGNLGLAIAFHNPKVRVYATDISYEAIELTIENIAFLKLEQRVNACQGDLFSSVDRDKYLENTDIIVCNPPYISLAKVKNMNPEISENEPVLAFDGGMLGTKIIQRLIVEAPKYLKKNGWLAFEVGVGQGDFIMQLCKRSQRYDLVESLSDMSGNTRVITARK